ncbi:hypothetical protein FGO68_gene9466 [Halteria grandinella]|uniref:Uncharacterized protein n=1 Tax=Halteria grandinella TaxID=5974 RepID=A0A8J8NI97_HALGN|nr:hypothetical protein FGO68_gene9466 [Halteria grandinella]
MDELDLMMKVIVVGDGRIGKTCLITKFVNGIFQDEYKKTLGVDFLQKKHNVKELSEDVQFHIWDTAGQEEYNSLTRRYYKGSSACVICFSTTDRESFNHVEKWKQQVENEIGAVPMVIVQTKIDLCDNAAMTENEVAALGKHLQVPVFKACSKDGTMVNEIFEFIAVRYFTKSQKAGEQKEEQQQRKDVIKLGATEKSQGSSTPAEQKKKKWSFGKCSIL